MISAYSFKVPRSVLVILVPLNLLIFLLTLNHYGVLNAFEVPGNSYFAKGSSQFLSPGEGGIREVALNEVGYQLDQQNVKFKFTNPKNKMGTRDEILKRNKLAFQEIATTPIKEPKDFDVNSIRPPEDPSTYKRANATILALVRNTETHSITKTIRVFEKKFNSKFQYPYTFINDRPFDDRFKKKMASLSSAKMDFITIPAELWDKPSFIDKNKETLATKQMFKDNVAYAMKQSYHNMCRFYSGKFYDVPELQKYKYYWRIEPDVKFYTDVKYDLFKYLEGTGKIYGFTVALYDIKETVKTLWPETLKFLNTGDNNKYINKNGAFQWLLENQQNPHVNEVTNGYSSCHFWSNFEIADMDFYRGEAYSEWFKHLDHAGGFYYERWGDAPVHSIGLSLFADRNKIHWFRDMGYFHDPYMNCPNHPDCKGCQTGKFSRWEHLSDQNCMMSWIDYAMDDPSAIY